MEVAGNIERDCTSYRLGEKRSDSIENIVPTAKPKQGQKQSQNSKLPPQSDPAQDPRREAKDTKPNKEVNIRENTMSSSPSSEAKKVPKGTEDKDQQVLPYGKHTKKIHVAYSPRTITPQKVEWYAIWRRASFFKMKLWYIVGWKKEALMWWFDHRLCKVLCNFWHEVLINMCDYRLYQSENEIPSHFPHSEGFSEIPYQGRFCKITLLIAYVSPASQDFGCDITYCRKSLILAILYLFIEKTKAYDSRNCKLLGSIFEQYFHPSFVCRFYWWGGRHVVFEWSFSASHMLFPQRTTWNEENLERGCLYIKARSCRRCHAHSGRALPSNIIV